VLHYEDIADSWDGAIHPNLHRQVDPRRILTDADIIVGMDPDSDEYFCIYGRDHLEDGGIPEGFRTVVIQLDPENKEPHELEMICAIVQVSRGRHDCQ
jgi:hypothetical protein